MWWVRATLSIHHGRAAGFPHSRDFSIAGGGRTHRLDSHLALLCSAVLPCSLGLLHPPSGRASHRADFVFPRAIGLVEDLPFRADSPQPPRRWSAGLSFRTTIRSL